MAHDVLRLKRMAFYGYHGLFPEEAKLGQRFEVDVEIFGNFRGYSTTGGEAAVNYPDVYAITEEVVTRERFGLVEALADRIAEALQTRLGLERLLVRVRKPHPPVAGHFDGIEVEVRRGI